MSGYCATIGFFDGVHAGHCHLIRQVQHYAADFQQKPLVITFKSHPLQTIAPERMPRLLTSLQERVDLLHENGVENVLLLDFNAEMQRQTSREFMLFLHRAHQVETLVVGYNHRFGSDRDASFEDYERYGKEIGMRVIHATPYYIYKEKVSSSIIRRQLEDGCADEAREILGRPYAFSGIVISGRRKGRELGFPTANISPKNELQLVPKSGVYAVKVEFDGKQFEGMLNIGVRPTLQNGTDRSIEVHLLHFDGNLYEKSIKVLFYHFLREEKKFDSLTALREQLQKDAVTVSNYFENLKS